MKKNAIILTVLLFLFLTLNVHPAYANSTKIVAPQINAKSAIVMDYETGQILYDKNGHAKVYPASTTKVLTAILALEKGNLDDIVTASKNAANVEGSKIYLNEGEQLTLRQLMYAMMVESANDAAVAIAEHIGGSVENFANMMNQKAQEIGAKDSHFVTPNGLHDPNHYTTAYDMALIARYAMKIPFFRQLVSTVTYEIPPTNKFKEKRILLNTNMLIRPTQYHYAGADGIKTGYTSEADKCLLATAVHNNRRVIVAIYDDNPDLIWKDAINLLNYGLDDFTTKTYVHKGDYVTRASVVNGTEAYVDLKAANDFIYTIPIDKADSIRSYKKIYPAKAPIKQGQTLGYISYELDDKEIGKVNLIASQAVKAKGWNNLYSKINEKEIDNYVLSHIGTWIYWSILAPGAFILGFWIKKRKMK